MKYMEVMTLGLGHTGGIQGSWDLGKVSEMREQERKGGRLGDFCCRPTP